jgi:hypothetical protein
MQREIYTNACGMLADLPIEKEFNHMSIDSGHQLSGQPSEFPMQSLKVKELGNQSLTEEQLIEFEELKVSG